MDDVKAVICPKCKRVISNYQETCPFCGLRQHSIQSVVMRRFKLDKLNLPQTIIYLSVGLFLLSYILPILLGANVGLGRGMFGLPAPSNAALSFIGWSSLNTVLQGEYWRLIIAIFLHGGPAHIFFNMMWVRNLSSVTTSLMSSAQFALVFITSGLIGNLTAIFSPIFLTILFGSPLKNVSVIGASGAIFGVMGSLIVLGRAKGGLAGLLLVKQVISWAAIIIILGFLMPGISNSAHIGGLITGLLLGKLFTFPSKVIENGVNLLALTSMGASILSFLWMGFRITQAFL